MSVEVVRLDDHRIYLIVGNPDAGYTVRRTSPVGVGHYTRKFAARQAIQRGAFDDDTTTEASD